jgi:hypothetical protein
VLWIYGLFIDPMSGADFVPLTLRTIGGTLSTVLA